MKYGGEIKLLLYGADDIAPPVFDSNKEFLISKFKNKGLEIPRYGEQSKESKEELSEEIDDEDIVPPEPIKPEPKAETFIPKTTVITESNKLEDIKSKLEAIKENNKKLLN